MDNNFIFFASRSLFYTFFCVYLYLRRWKETSKTRWSLQVQGKRSGGVELRKQRQVSLFWNAHYKNVHNPRSFVKSTEVEKIFKFVQSKFLVFVFLRIRKEAHHQTTTNHCWMNLQKQCFVCCHSRTHSAVDLEFGLCLTGFYFCPCLWGFCLYVTLSVSE